MDELVAVIQFVAGARELDEVAVPETVHFDLAGRASQRGSCSELPHLLIKWRAWPTRKAVGPAFGMLSCRYLETGILQSMVRREVAVDQYNRYKEDVNLIDKMNFDAYRYSISWSRIFPGLTPSATLYHYDLPLTIEKKYKGLLSRRIVKDFADYADFCFKTFGDRIKNWMTFNEPRVIATFGYDDGTFAPGRCSKAYGNCSAGNSATEPYIVTHNILLSHAAAVQRYREKYQEKQNGKIGIVLDFIWYEPLTRSKADNYAAVRARNFHTGWFLHPIIYGEYPKTMQNIVGERLPKFNEKNGVPIGPKGYLYGLYYVPWGMYKVLTYMRDRYGNPTMIIAKNGMDDPGNLSLAKSLHDTTRISYYKSYISNLKTAVEHGANVVGYFAWSLLDNFEWRLGYTSRFGIIYVDFNTLKRHPKMSALWFQQLLARKKQ
ncbi:hypothetical protein L6164_005395 [Bauhinia variegata]|uniref:Uncharacterized protein n=1 Tax=Bauhinia variegata TaxID=167791 RepID=A0ACB9PTR7_BAUVA|nr:hypothetical protein L6164_005395 [Bauhinia variegata]